MKSLPNAVISADELFACLSAPDIRIIDASFHLPDAGRDAAKEFLEGHIPGAQRFDINTIADAASNLPHMLPTAEHFGIAVAAMGISNSDTIVIYDTTGLFGAARAWWMFHCFGHERVRVLNGGLGAWQRSHHPLESGPARTPRPGHFQARLDSTAVRSQAEVLNAVHHRSARLVDARSASRFRGEAPEPRAGLRSGHIPGSTNVPLASILEEDGTLKNLDAISSQFRTARVDLTQPIITTCGSGVTACGLAFALHLLGAPDVGVYDGSWAEWGADADLPLEVGAPQNP